MLVIIHEVVKYFEYPPGYRTEVILSINEKGYYQHEKKVKFNLCFME